MRSYFFKDTITDEIYDVWSSSRKEAFEALQKSFGKSFGIPYREINMEGIVFLGVGSARMVASLTDLDTVQEFQEVGDWVDNIRFGPTNPILIGYWR